ncbi:olfactory receptor 1500-like [Gastrophryne carolinensis]
MKTLPTFSYVIYKHIKKNGYEDSALQYTNNRTLNLNTDFLNSVFGFGNPYLQRSIQIRTLHSALTQHNNYVVSYIVQTMEGENVTTITSVHLLGFKAPPIATFLIFFVFLTIYCVTICGNLLIITVVSYSKTLHCPMYFFLCQLAASDMLLATDILPNMLHTLVVKDAVISLSNCLTQFYFFGVSETSESLLLTVMSYDRYLAICRPLHYTMLMSHGVSWIMIIATWILSVLIALIYTLTVTKLQFCGRNVIDNFFCDVEPVFQLSCKDTTSVHLQVTLLGGTFVIVPFSVIIVSYIYIIITIFEIPSITGRQKVFSTCSSHLTIVCIYYGTIACVYLVPRGQSWTFMKFLSLPYTVLNPMMNPIIYSLRNKDLLHVLEKLTTKSSKLSF